MTPGEMKRAMDAGKVLFIRGTQWRVYADPKNEEMPYVLEATGDGSKALLSSGWSNTGWEILEDPEGYMTREEALGFCANRNGIVIRGDAAGWRSNGWFSFTDSVGRYEWAEISPRGVIGEPKKFLKKYLED